MDTSPQCFADSLVWVPLGLFERNELDMLKKRLSVFIVDFNPYSKKKGDWIRDYVLLDDMIGLPYRFGLQQLQVMDLEYEEELVEGNRTLYKGRPDPNHPNASDGQAKLMSETMTAVRANGSILLKAPTGSGKSCVALNTIAELGTTALVIVDTTVLARQWVKEAKRHLEVEDDEISIMSGKNCDYEGKKIVVAVIHNLVMKDHPDEFLDYFGTVVWDEAHILGAAFFAKSKALFAAKYRIALTATPSRKDGATSLLTDHFGDPAVEGTSDALASLCRVYNRYDKIDGVGQALKGPRLVNKITEDLDRNTDIASLINLLYEEDRQILVLSDRIEQLQVLMGLCYELHQIQDEKMGLFSRVWRDDRGKQSSIKDSELDEVVANCQIIFATYHIARKGLDIPRLDAGVEASPIGEPIQPIGRIRRPLPNKRTPLWVSINDKFYDRLSKMTARRIRELRKENVEIEYDEI